jgi:hypothetical protein
MLGGVDHEDAGAQVNVAQLSAPGATGLKLGRKLALVSSGMNASSPPRANAITSSGVLPSSTRARPMSIGMLPLFWMVTRTMPPGTTSGTLTASSLTSIVNAGMADAAGACTGWHALRLSSIKQQESRQPPDNSNLG